MNRLKELREQKKISQSELANLTNVKQNTISNWEQNKTEIDQNNLLLLADYFGVTLDYLLCRDMFVGKLNTLSQEHKQLIDYYEQCDEIDKVRILAYAEAVAENNKEVYKNVSLEKKKNA